MQNNRGLIVILAVGLVMIAVIGAGLILFYPRSASEGSARLTGESENVTTIFDPIEYLREEDPEPIAPLTEPAPIEDNQGDEFIIVYGTEPDQIDPDSPIDPSVDSLPTERTGEGAEPPSPAAAQPAVTQPTVTQPTAAQPAVIQPAVTQPAAAQPAAPQPIVEPAQARRVEPQSRRAAPPKPAALERSTTPVNSGATRAETTAAVREPGNRWIQLIATPSRDRVETARNALGEYQIKGRITTEIIAGNTYFRLRVGPFVNSEEANKFLDWMRQIPGFGNSFITSL